MLVIAPRKPSSHVPPRTGLLQPRPTLTQVKKRRPTWAEATELDISLEDPVLEYNVGRLPEILSYPVDVNEKLKRVVEIRKQRGQEFLRELDIEKIVDEASELSYYLDMSTGLQVPLSEIIYGKYKTKESRKELVSIYNHTTRPKKDTKIPTNLMYSNRLFASLAHKYNIMVIAEVSFFPLVNYDTRANIEKFFPIRAEQGDMSEYSPLVPNVPAGCTAPRQYMPTYKWNSYDSELFDTMLTIITLRPDQDVFMADLALLTETIKNYYYGNGTLAGQFGRLAAVDKVREAINAMARVPQNHVIATNYLYYKALMDKRFPCHPRPMRFEGNPYTVMVNNLNADGTSPVRLTKNAGSGILWRHDAHQAAPQGKFMATRS